MQVNPEALKPLPTDNVEYCNRTFSNGCALRVAVQPYPPFSHPCAFDSRFFGKPPSPLLFLAKRRRMKCPYPGFEMEFMHSIAWILNISLHFVQPSDEGWGEIQENRTFDGIIGMLDRDEIDMSMGLLWADEKRFGIVDFAMLKTFRYAFAVRSPPRTTVKTFSMEDPFSLPVWYMIGLSILLFLIYAGIAALVHFKASVPYMYSIAFVFNWNAPSTYTLKRHYTVLSLSMVIPIATLMTIYTSDLMIALIPRKELILPFQGYYSLHKLVADGEFVDITRDKGDTFASMAFEDGLEPNITGNSLIIRNVTKIFNVIRTSQSRNYFFLDDPYMIRHWKRTYCDISVVLDEEGPIRLMGLAFQKGSGLAKRFEEIVPEKFELYDLIYDRYEAYGREECTFDRPQLPSFTFENLKEGFIIYIVGNVLAVVAFTVERLIVKRSRCCKI